MSKKDEAFQVYLTKIEEAHAQRIEQEHLNWTAFLVATDGLCTDIDVKKAQLRAKIDALEIQDLRLDDLKDGLHLSVALSIKRMRLPGMRAPSGQAWRSRCTMQLREELEARVAEGYIRSQRHPSLPLTIYNYTEKAEYEKMWDEYTRMARGLILHDDGHIVARPYPKFFNYGWAEAAHIELDEPVQVTDKIDGSLGILYPTPAGYAIATRGSFTSDQALHATAILNERYADVVWEPYYTYLFEIVFPSNRIVVDYGSQDDLVALGCIDHDDGQIFGTNLFPIAWKGPRTRIFEYKTLAEALAAKPRVNAEGFVVRSTITGAMVKIKQEDYVALHRIVTGLNARVVWQHLKDNKPLEELLAPLPQEFQEWVQGVADDLEEAVEYQNICLVNEYLDLWDYLDAKYDPGWTRGEFAAEAKKSDNAWAMFAQLDGKDLIPVLWEKSKPIAGVKPGGTEDAE